MDLYDFGARLKSLREAKKLTQVQVANKLNLSRSLLSEYESNQKVPTAETIKALAQIYGTTTDYILGLCNGIVISTDGLTISQQEVLKSAIESISTEFRKSNK